MDGHCFVFLLENERYDRTGDSHSRVLAQCINRINVYLLNNVCITFSLYVENELVL